MERAIYFFPSSGCSLSLAKAPIFLKGKYHGASKNVLPPCTTDGSHFIYCMLRTECICTDRNWLHSRLCYRSHRRGGSQCGNPVIRHRPRFFNPDENSK